MFDKVVLQSLIGSRVVAEGRPPDDIALFNNHMMARESAIALREDNSPSGGLMPAGRFQVGTWRGKLVVSGSVDAPDSEVYVAINGRIIKVIKGSPAPAGAHKVFKFAFGSSVLRLLPGEFSISVSCRSGLLAAETGAWVWGPLRGRGSGEIFDRLMQGWTIDKWGQIALPISQKPAWREAVLGAYQRFADYAVERFGIEMYLVAGTLLGAVREKDFIAHDDDMDVGYFSKHTRAEAVRDEMFGIIRTMIDDGWKLRVAHNRGFFHIYAGVGDAKFDVFPAWYEDGHVWMHNSQRMPAGPEMMAPARRATFLGRSVFFPNQPELYLAQHYGPTWRIPDRHYQERKKPGVHEGLQRARLTAEQVAALQGTTLQESSSAISQDGALPLVWWNQTPNIGALLSPWLVKKLSGREVVFADRTKPHYLAGGTILDKANDNSIVWGTGSFGTENRGDLPKGATYLATRGPLTRNKIDTAKLRCPRVYGDPALLVPNYYPRTREPTHELGIVIRWSEIDLREIRIRDVKVIDLGRDDVEGVLEDILSCKRILSSSLCGLMLADAYGIPNAWCVTNSPKGREFKFWDYFISVGKLRKPNKVRLLGSDLTLAAIVKNIEYNARPIDIDLSALLEACPFRA